MRARVQGILSGFLVLLLSPAAALGASHYIGPVANKTPAQWQQQSHYQPKGRPLRQVDPRYVSYFDNHWRSIRTFKLLDPLEAPLKVYVETRPKNSQLYRPEYFDYVREGLEAWAKALDGRLKYEFTEHPHEAQILVQWVAAFDEQYTAGDAITRFGHSSIRIKTTDLPPMDIKANILHEFGHALGINGHSDNPEDIMVGMRHWTTDQNYRPRLSVADQQAIRRLYSDQWRKGEDLYTPDQVPLPQSIALAPGQSHAKVNIHDYITEITRSINLRWRRPEGVPNRPVVVSFEVNHDGQLLYSKINRSSGSRLVDQAALDTIQQAGPFKPFPQHFPTGSMRVESTLY